jgi:LPXTG-site transpeptidase (sortase) family protein
MNPLKNMSTSRRLLFLAGSGIFIAGVVVLCFALLGSGSDSRGGPARAEDIPVRTFTHVPTFTSQPTPAVTPIATPPPVPPLTGKPYRMVIDSIGVNAPVESYGLDENLIPIVPTGDNAADVVAWYDFSSEPGGASNVVFGGHVTWFGSAVFYNLAAVAAGDDIKLVADDGTQVVYKVTDVYRVSAHDEQAVKVMWPTPDPAITLITCVGDFVDTGDPVFGGEYTDRLVVRGTLADVSGGAAAAAAGG